MVEQPRNELRGLRAVNGEASKTYDTTTAPWVMLVEYDLMVEYNHTQGLR